MCGQRELWQIIHNWLLECVSQFVDSGDAAPTVNLYFSGIRYFSAQIRPCYVCYYHVLLTIKAFCAWVNLWSCDGGLCLTFNLPFVSIIRVSVTNACLSLLWVIVVSRPIRLVPAKRRTKNALTCDCVLITVIIGKRSRFKSQNENRSHKGIQSSEGF